MTLDDLVTFEDWIEYTPYPPGVEYLKDEAVKLHAYHLDVGVWSYDCAYCNVNGAKAEQNAQSSQTGGAHGSDREARPRTGRLSK